MQLADGRQLPGCDEDQAWLKKRRSSTIPWSAIERKTSDEGFWMQVVGEHERSDPVNLITKPIAAIGHGCRRRHLPCDRGAYDFALPLFGDYLRGGRKLRNVHAS